MLDKTFRKCGHSSALLNVDSTFEFLECTINALANCSYDKGSVYGVTIAPTTIAPQIAITLATIDRATIAPAINAP